MTKNIKIMAILFVFVMQSMTTWASTINGLQVYFQYKSTKKIGDISHPSRVPAKQHFSLNAFYDDAEQQLTLTDLSSGVYSYTIYGDNEIVMSQGVLNFNNGDILYIDLWGYQRGTYTLEIVYGGCTYFGTFEIN